MTTTKMPPVHPGEVLVQEFLEPLGMTQHKLAVRIGVPPRRVNEIVHGKRGISADTAVRLQRFFGVSAEYWMGLQSQYELMCAEDRMEEAVEKIVPFSDRAA
ncbi:HigA family addiction module antidote protein [Corynebacterium poyangense]|uniref:HigA family addiction module antidote protein n=1 Tax=Corynebacterium poyangense TaxID=2684405 RepID=A0A7H0SQA9_9CORY|nr:HigA family addiction module antitoxin [Corynebacterium poyangense]QNQ90734.1 HigA family addiction module antidote protein [Corynebacterium poyangense]